MAGSITKYSNERIGNWRIITLKWTADASGDVTDAIEIQLPTCQVNSFLSVPITGVSDDFDLTLPVTIPLPDGSSVDIADALSASGSNLSNSTDGEAVNLGTPFPLPHGSKLKVKVDNAGNATSGYLWLMLWQED